MANKQFNIGKQSLGQGAFGHVYRGTMMHEKQEIDVAIKRVTNDGDIYMDIKKECDLLNAVQGHRNIIKLLGLEKDENFIYVIMELGDSGDLDHFLMSGEPSLEDKVSIMHGTASAVAYMHNLPDPIIHMDIKPGNIIIMKAPSGVVAKVCDFGFARMFKPKFGVQYMSTKTGATSWYRAPELFAYDRKKYDASIDTFALGLVFLVVINFNDEEKSLDPNPTQLRKGALLQYGQHMNLAKQKAEKMPELFTLSADDIWPLVELKSLVTQMTSFHPKDRIKMADVEVVLRCIEQKTTTARFCNALKGENEDQSNLLAIKNETITNLSEERDNYSKENEALKLQLRKQDEQMQQKDHLVYESETKAAEKDEKIQMLESEVSRKSMTLLSNTSAITALQRENQENKQILVDKDKHIQSNTRHNEENSQLLRSKDREIGALKSQLTQREEKISELQLEASQKDLRLETQATARVKAITPKTAQSVLPAAEKEVVSSHKSVQTEEFVTSFRHTSVDLKLLFKPSSGMSRLFSTSNIKCVNKFTIQKDCHRMCFVNSSIYCPCPGDNSLVIYSVEGKLIKDIKLQNIRSPRAMHPLSEGRLVLAARSGLYEVDYDGRVMCQVMEGGFSDVHVSGHLMAVIENYVEKSDKSDIGADSLKSGHVDRSDRIHILSITAPYPQSAGFSVGHKDALTVLLSEDASTVCVSDDEGHHITTYSLSGRQISQAGGPGRVQPGGLMWPYLCATDSSGQMLICDWGNNRLQLLSAGGEWAVLSGVQVEGPTDAFIHENKMYVMNDYRKISVSKIV